MALHNFALNPDDIERINKLSLDQRVVTGKKQWQQALKGEPQLAKKIENVFNTLTATKPISSACQYVSRVEDLIEKVIDFKDLNDHLDPTFAWKQKESLAQFRRQLSHLMQEEDVLTKLQAKFTTDYYARLIELIEKANFTAPAPSAQQILITNAELMPNQQYKQIYLAGLLEGEFPAIKTNTGFLTAQELEQWRKLGINLYNPRMEAGFEYALFASLINRATEKVILSYPSVEITSNKDELLPSFFFNALDVSLKLPLENKKLSEMPLELFTSPRNLFSYNFWQGDQWQGHQSIALLDDIKQLDIVSNFVDQLKDQLHFAQIRSKQLTQSPVNGYLVEHVAAVTTKITLPEYWNASQLNDYGKCPFSFWLSRMLKVAPHAEPEIGLSIQDRGTFYHKALEIFYQNIIDAKISINLEQEKKLQEIFAQSLQSAFDWLEQESWFRPTEFWLQEKNTLAFRLNNFFAAEFKRFIGEMGQYEPYIVEAVFGPNGQYAPLVLNKNGKTIKIRGKIDRIDIETNNFGANKKLRLIDYKSGSTFISKDDFVSGRNMQLAIYALAAQKCILPNSKVQSYQYLSISTGKTLSAKKQDEMSVQEDLNYLEDKLFTFVENIEKGDFSVNPSNDKVCITCVHKTICRVKEFPL